MVELLVITLAISLPLTAVACFLAGAHVANRSRVGRAVIGKKTSATVWSPLLETPKEEAPYTP